MFSLVVKDFSSNFHKCLTSLIEIWHPHGLYLPKTLTLWNGTQKELARFLNILVVNYWGPPLRCNRTA